MSNIGVVVIGRNEGERLKVCIRSLASSALRIVYVDSGSTDDSVNFVENMDFDVVPLDMSRPFSAARARNEGYDFLIKRYPEVEFIQFVDGDCEVREGWIDSAYAYLQNNTALASVCGRRRERYPNKTIYNRLCDLEWNTPVGISGATGGDFLCRRDAFDEVGGFSAAVIAGEEPEMCFRMRQKGWLIERLPEEMTWHDADMTSCSQWWKRNERSGHAYAQGFYLHGNSKEKYYRADVVRILVWVIAIPLVIALCAILGGASFLIGILIYPIKVMQIAMRERASLGLSVSLKYAVALVLGKFPQCKGIVVFVAKHLRKKNFQIIEYK